MNAVSRIFMAICHPLLMLTYALLLMILSNPYLFGATCIKQQLPFIAIVLFSTFVIPGVAILMMRGLNMTPSLRFKERKELVGPLFSTCILYSAFYFNVNHSGSIPAEYTNFLVGALLTLFCCLFINSFYKVSLYSAALSNLAMGMFIFYFSGQADQIDFGLGDQTVSVHFVLVPLVLLVTAGLLGTMRMLYREERMEEVLAGWLVGVFGQVIATFL